jgi:hypothetical protein
MGLRSASTAQLANNFCVMIPISFRPMGTVSSSGGQPSGLLLNAAERAAFRVGRAFWIQGGKFRDL